MLEVTCLYSSDLFVYACEKGVFIRKMAKQSGDGKD